jgi:lysophospholipase L1-like esterase
VPTTLIRGLVHGVATTLLLVGLSAIPSGSPVASDDPVRILVVGDSITQGSSGDWTWRYRLWQHLTGHGVDFELVGPRNDLWEYVEAHDGSQAYIDAGFDRDHASRWGMSLASMSQDPPVGIGYSISQLVVEFHPDVVVEMLGVNDLAFGGKTPSQLAGMLQDFVEQVRTVDPSVALVLGRIPQPWRSDVQAFNPLVDGLAHDLDTVESPVVVADADTDYSLADSFDSAHPNARGELKIAAAVEDALAQLGVGPVADRPIPQVPLGPRIPPVLSASGGLRQAELSWVRSPGSRQSEVWARDATIGGDWHLVLEHQTELSATVDGLPGWHQIQLQTAPYKGDLRAQPDAWSNMVEVEVRDDHLATPAVSATATPAGVATVAWASVPGALAYAVEGRSANQPGVWLDMGTTTRLSATVGGLLNRAGYVFRVRAVRGALASNFSVETLIVVPPLPAMRRVRVTAAKAGVRTTARSVSGATSYTLRVATTRRCGRPPVSSSFAVVASGLTRTSKRLRLDARAVWVQWVAARSGIEGELARSSTACVRLRH